LTSGKARQGLQKNPRQSKNNENSARKAEMKQKILVADRKKTASQRGFLFARSREALPRVPMSKKNRASAF
jgi:DNA-binding TFAR19-related protein (PDSD5 family)